MPPLELPLDHEGTHGLRVARRPEGWALELVRAPLERRFALERALRRHLLFRAGEFEARLAAETDLLVLPEGTVRAEVLLGQTAPFRLAVLELYETASVAEPPYVLSPFETRFLADNGFPHPVERPETGLPGLVTDLHTHFAGCVLPEDLLAIGLERGVTYPAELLERAGIRTGRMDAIPLVELPPELRRLLAARLALPLDRQVPFHEMEAVYRFRAPLTKSRAAFVPQLHQIARDYARMGVRYAELSLFDILEGDRLEAVHRELPGLERETGVALRFLAAFNRHDDLEWDLDLIERLGQLARSRYLAGVDFMGQETNSTRAFERNLRAVAAFADANRPGFVLRVHAGENPAHPENVRVALECVAGSSAAVRIGHGLYGTDERTLELLRASGAIVEFNLNSNLALNNLQSAAEVPLQKYVAAGIPCVLGTDGYGLYRTSPALEVQAARLAGLDAAGLEWIRETERRYLEGRRAHEEAHTLPPAAFQAPPPLPPRHYTPGVAARRKAEAERRDQALAARLLELGVPLLPIDAAGRLLDGKRVLCVAGAWRKSWEAVSPLEREKVERELRALADGLDVATTVLVTGGTSWGVEGILQRSARERSLTVLGALVNETPPAALEAGALTHATLVAEKLHGKAAGLYQLMKEHGGLCLFIGGGHIVSDEIQAAANLRLPFLLMDGPEGASTLHARQQPARSFTRAEEVLRVLGSRAPWPSTNDPYWHLGANPIADVVVTRHRPGSGRLEVLLVRRHEDAAAEPGAWALPGGFQHTDAPRGTPWTPGSETAEEAAVRELKEETGLDVGDLRTGLLFAGDFEGAGRDPRDTPRAWSRSRAFALHLPPDRATSPIAGGDDAGDARWFDLHALPPRLAFDHGRILTRALERLGHPRN